MRIFSLPIFVAAIVGVLGAAMLIATAVPPATGADEKKATGTEPTVKDRVPPTVEERVEQLASKDEPPPIPDHEDGRKHPYPVFPKDFDWPHQERVRAAWKELHDRFEEAAPVLVEHFRDKRYAATYTSPTGAWRNNSVADICHDIFDDNVLPFSRPPGLRSVGPDVFKEDGGVVELWRSCRDRPLADLQIKVIDRFIEWDERLEMNESKSRKVPRPEIHEKYRERLRKEAEQIRTSGKPVHGLAIGDWHTFAKESDRKSRKR
jgi:hypothetical protein